MSCEIRNVIGESKKTMIDAETLNTWNYKNYSCNSMSSVFCAKTS